MIDTEQKASKNKNKKNYEASYYIKLFVKHTRACGAA